MTESDLVDYFSRFGGIKQAEIKRDKKTKLSKGYAFIRCRDPETEELIMGLTHEINGRKVDVNKAVEKCQTENLKKSIYNRKLFIENIGTSLKDSKNFSLFFFLRFYGFSIYISDLSSKKFKDLKFER